MAFGAMKPKWKKAWVAALRSGQYGQGRFALSSPGGRKMCCIGVLCDLADPEGWDDKVKIIKTQYGRKRIRPHRGEDGFASKTVLRRVLRHNASLPFGTLIALNDVRDKSFPEIADWIEDNL